MTDTIVTDNSELVHRVLSIVRNIDTQEQEATFAKYDALCQLEQSEAWKGYNGCKSWRQFLADAGLKYSTTMQGMKAVSRFAHIVRKESIPVVFSRLVAALSLKHESADQDRDIILSLCSRDVPHTHYKTSLASRKGSKQALECDHVGHGREVWNKCLNCHTWIKDEVK